MEITLSQHEKALANLQLKGKAKSLAEEAKIIRKEEKKLGRRISKIASLQKPTSLMVLRRDNLRDHRVHDVRNEARATHIARAFLNGKPFSSVEKNRNSYYETWGVHNRTTQIIRKYCFPYKSTDSQEVNAAIKKWVRET